MQNREKLHEKYEEALFTLLMDEIAELEGQVLLKEAERLNKDPNAAFPERLDRKCWKIIQGSFRKEKVKTAGKFTIRLVQRVAVAALVAVTLIVAACAAIPQVRVNILNLLLTVTDQYTGLGFTEGTTKEPMVGEFSISNYTLPDIPVEFPLIFVDEDEKQRAFAYENDSGGAITIDMVVGSTGSIYSVDTEDAEEVHNIWVNGYKGLLILKNGTVIAAWADTDNMVFFSIWTNSFDQEAVLSMANSIKYVNSGD